jgi:hypothetical protein
MDFGKDGSLGRFRWQIIIIGIVLAAVVLLIVFTEKGFIIPQFLWPLGAVVLLIAVVTMLSKILIIADVIRQTSKSLEEIADVLEKSHAMLTQINQNIPLSETTRAIAFRDADRQSLREAVLSKLHQQDFETTYEMIDEIAHSTRYKKLAEQLKIQADKYRDATDIERANQVIAHVEKLLENCQWSRASAQIERLIWTYPKSEKAKAMRQKLIDKKQERKKELLVAWDDAVKRQDTDRSLEILRELDLYLTPNEGLALQEAARDIFRSKLHNLGVQFSFAVSEKQWANALKTGQQIIHDFPNSKMAQEIRAKIEILRQRVRQQQ